ncbi:MAG: ABC transporter ATP-binding protein/permease [Clostridiales bacterium]|uniref:ABC transporter ATP-binding protein n=1 Tax=Flavonifractor porci TaxID=3133422 RepID=UPI00309DD284|nr:ABC transporter ATP-binding protein/permease [Clostridiales bacterium]
MNQKKPGAIRQLLNYAGESKWKLYLSSFLAIVGELLGMVPFFVVTVLIQQIYLQTVTMQSAILLFFIALAGQLGKVFFTYESSFMSHKATYRILKNIRSLIADKMQRVPIGVVLDTPTGAWKNLMVDTVSKLEDSMAHFMPEIASNIVAPICCLIVSFALDWRMGLASLSTIPLGALGYIGMMRDYENKSATYMRAQNEMNSTLVEYVNGIEVIKAFHQSAASYGKFTNAINFFHDSTLAWWKQSWFWSAFVMAVMPSTLLGTLPAGAWLYMNGDISLSVFVTCLILPLGLIAPLMRIGKYSDQFSIVNACLDQIGAFLDKEELHRPERPVQLDPKESFHFQSVTFAYDEEKVLDDVSFTIKPGTVTAIVGPSGSGKSTIAKLMAGFWDASRGQVCYGGKSIKEIPFQQLMDEISYVAQDNFLFDESIRENIRMGNPSATDDEVEAAAKAAQCHDFILQLEHGYDTTAGDAGGRLSGGERQRITIARAMLKKANVVILDEATAHADPENEALIQAAINRLVKGKTLIVVAHRLATVQDADTILVMEQGKIAGSGKHQQLLESCPLYHRLWSDDVRTADTDEDGVSEDDLDR